MSTPSPSKRKRVETSMTASARGKGQIIVVDSTTPKRKPPINSTPQMRRVAAKDAPPLEPQTPSPKKKVKIVRVNARVPSRLYDSDDSGKSGVGDDALVEDASPMKHSATPAKLHLPELSGNSSIRRTASDVYFYLTSKPSKTSANVFSSLLPQLTPEECEELTKSSNSHITKKHPALLAALQNLNEAQFAQWIFELSQGFNLLFYGYGSKMLLLNHFAQKVASKKGYVVVVNGFFSPHVTLKNVLDSIEQRIPALSQETSDDTIAASSAASGMESQAQHIYRHFLSSKTRLFLVVHNIEHSPQLRTPRVRSLLALLASNPQIHFVASVDNIHSAVMWTTTEILGRKHCQELYPMISVSPTKKGRASAKSQQPGIPSSRGFAWLWHEATTFEPYDIELAFRDLSILPRTKTGITADVAGMNDDGTPVIKETAAKQVLVSVTQKASRLFEVLGRAQLAALIALEQQGDGGSRDRDKNVPATVSMSYELLAVRAREEFLATSDGALRALLTEFRDHGLVVQISPPAASSGIAATPGEQGKVAGDVLWIPLARDVLSRILDGL